MAVWLNRVPNMCDCHWWRDEAVPDLGRQDLIRMDSPAKFQIAGNCVFVECRLLLAGSHFQSMKSAVRRTSPQLGPQKTPLVPSRHPTLFLPWRVHINLYNKVEQRRVRIISHTG